MNTPQVQRPNARSGAVTPQRRRFAITALGAAAVALSFAGCAVVPPRPRFVGELVLDAPPPAQAEAIGVAPGPGYVWMGGYWNWVGGRHVWVAGHWSPPRAGLYWVPHVWVHTGAGWHLREGYWARG